VEGVMPNVNPLKSFDEKLESNMEQTET